MKTLISAEKIAPLIFTRDEPYGTVTITATDIAEAESHYLLPIVGNELYNAMLSGGYTELVDEYVAPMVAAWVRYIIEPHLTTRCCITHSERNITIAMNENSKRVLRALRDKAATLSCRLSDHLNANSAEYVEYNPSENPLNRCFIYGDIIQVY